MKHVLCWLCAMHHVSCFRKINSFNSHKTPRNKFCWFSPHSGEKNWGTEIYPRSYSQVTSEHMSATTILCWDVRMWRDLLVTWGLEARRRNHVQPEDDETIKQNLNEDVLVFMYIWPESLRLLVSYLKEGYWSHSQPPKWSSCWIAQASASKLGIQTSGISSVNKLLCGELLNISFSISKMQILDIWCLFHFNTGKAAGLHSSKWCPSLGVFKDNVKSGTQDLTWWDNCRGRW